jgi:gluconolactonase
MMVFTKSRLVVSLIVACAAALSTVASAGEALIAKGATLHRVSSEFTFTEGPARNSRGDVYFTDQPSNRILRWSENGSIVEVTTDAGRANGLYFDRDGNLLACADLNNELWKITPTGEIEVLVGSVHGKRLNGPNDLWISPAGGLYFTDPFFQRDYWTRRGKEIDVEGVYFLSSEGQVRLVADDLVKPNGIIGTADGSTLYVADIGDDKTYRYEVQADGSLESKTLFAPMGSDGMTLDEQGNVYLTGDGVTIFNRDGKKISHIDVPEKWTANITFGGKERRTLFITASKSIYTLEMQVAGQ